MSLIDRIKTGPRVEQYRVDGDVVCFLLTGGAVRAAEVRVNAVDLLDLKPFKQQGATIDSLEEVTISPEGTTILWPVADVDMTTATLLGLLLGIQAPQATGAQGGSATGGYKAAAARLNGSKGGRPRKNPEDG